MTDEWLSARKTMKLAKESALSTYHAEIAICSRANDDLIKARARRLIVGDRADSDVLIERGFWWARGGTSLIKNWITGDFETHITPVYDEIHVRAYGVEFEKTGVLSALGLDSMPKDTEQAASTKDRGGRPPAEWWDDLWIEICRQLFCGDLIPKRQADIVKAMQEWIEANEHSAADSTLKPKARKLFRAITAEDKNPDD